MCLNSGRFEDVAAPVGGVGGRGAADTFLLADYVLKPPFVHAQFRPMRSEYDDQVL